VVSVYPARVVTLVATACLLLQNTNDDDDENGVRCLAIDGSTFLSRSLSGHKNDDFKENAYTRTTTPNKASLFFSARKRSVKAEFQSGTAAVSLEAEK
jgi:hypothetical protein